MAARDRGGVGGGPVRANRARGSKDRSGHGPPEGDDESETSDSKSGGGGAEDQRSRGLRVEYVALSELERWPRNPKTHDLDQLERSIRRFGFTSPIIVDDTTSKIVAGHGRQEALSRIRDRGERPPQNVRVRRKEWLVPVVRGLSFASEQEAEAYLLADNRLVEMGGWDFDELKQSFQFLSDTEIVGWTESEIEKIIGAEKIEASSADLIPLQIEPPPRRSWVLIGIPVVRFGEISDAVERISKMDGVIVRTAVNDD